MAGWIRSGIDRSVHDHPGIGPRLALHLEAPDRSSFGRFRGSWVDYANTGDADMPAPILLVDSVSTTFKMRQGDVLIEQDGQLRLFGASSTGPAGILRPGDAGRIPFSFQRQDSATTQFSMTLRAITVNDRAFDWPAYEADMRPDGVDPLAWQQQWAQITHLVGDTWQQVYATISDMANMSPAAGDNRYSFDGLVLYAATLAQAEVGVDQEVSPAPGQLAAASSPDSAAELAGYSGADVTLRWHIPQPHSNKVIFVTHGQNASLTDPALISLGAAARRCVDCIVVEMDWSQRRERILA